MFRYWRRPVGRADERGKSDQCHCSSDAIWLQEWARLDERTISRFVLRRVRIVIKRVGRSQADQAVE